MPGRLPREDEGCERSVAIDSPLHGGSSDPSGVFGSSTDAHSGVKGFARSAGTHDEYPRGPSNKLDCRKSGEDHGQGHPGDVDLRGLAELLLAVRCQILRIHEDHREKR